MSDIQKKVGTASRTGSTVGAGRADTAGHAWVLALTSLGFFMAMMDSMIVTTASTAIREDFDASVGQLQWTLNAYNVAVEAFLLIGVAIGGRIGHRRLYTIGLLLFVIGSVACALSPSLDALIASRVLQGIGASVMTPMSMAILFAASPPSRRGRALGIWSGVGGLALIIGPALGGAIVSQLGWQWVFWINVPIGLIGMHLSQRRLPESEAGGRLPNALDSVSSSPPREESSGHCPRASSQPAAPARWSSARSASRWDPCSCFGSESRPHR